MHPTAISHQAQFNIKGISVQGGVIWLIFLGIHDIISLNRERIANEDL